MSDLDVLLKKLVSSKEFKEFKDKNKDAFLYACFFVSEGNWQFDYYNPKDKLIITFEVSEAIKVTPVDKALGSNSKISELDLSKVKVGFDDAMSNLNGFVASQYPNDKFITKNITILQNIGGNAVWNITFLTSTLKLINVKLDASSGKVLSHCIESFLSMR